MLFQVEYDIVVVNLKGRRLLIASLIIYLLVCMLLWLFPMAYFGKLECLYEFFKVDNLLSSILVTTLIVLLAGAFLFIKIRKKLTNTKRKAVWQIIGIHVMVVLSEYFLLDMLANDAKLSALSIMFQIASVGLSRALAINNLIFEFYLTSQRLPH